MMAFQLRQLSAAALLLVSIGACAQTPTERTTEVTTARSHDTVADSAGDDARQKQVPEGLQLGLPGIGTLILP